MSLTNQQARRILLELYAESHDSSDTMFGVLNSTRLAAIWHACKVLKDTKEKRAPGRPSRTAEVPEGETGKAG